MTTHERSELDRIGRLVRREFSAGLMSDTKWRKFFAVLAKHRETAGLMLEVKFVDVTKICRMPVPREGDFWCPRPYLDTTTHGPIELRAIEWLAIRRHWELPRGAGLAPRLVPQQIDAIPRLLARIGKFPIRETDDGLRVDGYVR